MSAADIARALRGRRSRRGWTARCPAHQDKRPSLSIAENNGKILVHCFAGCSQDAIIDALRSQGIWPEQERQQCTHAERREWIRERKELEGHLPAARLWQHAAVVWAEQELVTLKAALFDPTLPQPDIDWLQRLEAFLKSVRLMNDGTLVARYRSWTDSNPWLTRAMVQAARNRAQAAQNVLMTVWDAMNQETAGNVEARG
jgi:hypothetical protein